MVFMPTDRINKDFARLKADRFRSRIQLDASVYDVTVSIGALLIHPGENITCEKAIKKADSALYVSKEAGRNRVTIYQKTSVEE